MAEERPAKRARVEVEVDIVDKEPVPLAPEDEDDFDDEEEEEQYKPSQPDTTRTSDLYLDTINRATLDFDFEKLCSVCLSNINIYGCLVCGKYFQGRGRKSYAYAHSIHDDHHVFINLETKKVFTLKIPTPQSAHHPNT